MSKYTTEVRFICESESGLTDSVGFDNVETVIEAAIPNIFSFDFPIFDEEYREVICTKILKHYYTREIGFETVGLWKLKLSTKLNEIMPYYNQLYKSELIKFNPLYDTDLQTTHIGDKNSENTKEENKTGISAEENSRSETGSINRTNDNVEQNTITGTANNESNVFENTNKSGSNSKADNSSEYNANNGKKDNTHYDLYSDTPQGALNGVEDEEYLTNARKVTDGETTKNDSSSVKDSKESGQFSENNSGTSIGNSENKYREQNDKTNIGKESTEDSRSTSGTLNRNNIENINGKDKFTSTESYILHVTGKQSGVSFSKMLKEFRETFLNIDMEVIKELSDLFMLIW